MIYGVIALVGVAAIVGGFDALAERANGGSLAAIVALATAAGGAAAAAMDLTTLLLLLETLALAGYALVYSARTNRSAEAAMKYFVQGAVATGLLLFGVAILVGLFAPSGEYSDIAQALQGPSALMPALGGVVLVLCGLLFKMGAAPFHAWVPDAYETAPSELTAFLATGPKVAAIGATGVFVTVATAGQASQVVLLVVAGVAIASILIGSVAALRQSDYRRLLAYAGIAQSGYALVAIALPMAPLAIFFASTYAVAAAGTFVAASAFSRLKPDWDGSVAGLAGLGRRAPVLSGALAVLLISLSGLPPLLGFWAKLTVFGTALSYSLSGASTMPWPTGMIGGAVAVAILGSIVSLGYYGAVLRSLFFDAPDIAESQDSIEESPSPRLGSAAVVVLVVAVIVVVLSALPFVLGPSALFDVFSAV